ncbi:MAG: biotin/lipoate A/B protein ligase family protein [Kiloniellaceae bacterium]
MADACGSGARARPGQPSDLRAGEVFSAFSCWAVRDDHDGGRPEARVARDADLGRKAARGIGPPTVRVWDNGRALVVGRGETGLPRFGAAVAALAEEGWPVVVRDTGGTAVPQGPGIVNLSLVMPRHEEHRVSLEAVYHALCAPLGRALHGMGVAVAFGEVPGSFCDGRYNLVARGRKIAGTAQAWRIDGGPGRRGRGYVLAHASLLVDCDLVPAIEIVNRFYRLAEAGRRPVSAEGATTVRECVAAVCRTPGQRRVPDLTGEMRARIVEALKVVLGSASSWIEDSESVGEAPSRVESRAGIAGSDVGTPHLANPVNRPMQPTTATFACL